MLLLDCLESEDETIKHMTIKILFKNVNENNIELIVENIHKFIVCTPDIGFKKWSISKLYQIIESKAPQPSWFLRKSLLILEHGSEFVDSHINNSVIRNIQDILSFDEESFQAIIQDFMQIFQEYIESKFISDSFIIVFIWFLGEYFQHLDVYFTKENFIELIDYIFSKNMKASETLSFIINSIKKIHDKTENQNLKKAIKNKWSQIKTVSSDNNVRVNEYSD